MNSGTEAADSRAGDDRDHEDGAIAFYFDLGGGKAFTHWDFVKSASQTIVNDSQNRSAGQAVSASTPAWRPHNTRVARS